MWNNPNSALEKAIREKMAGSGQNKPLFYTGTIPAM